MTENTEKARILLDRMRSILPIDFTDNVIEKHTDAIEFLLEQYIKENDDREDTPLE
jgi:hypothetical protein